MFYDEKGHTISMRHTHHGDSRHDRSEAGRHGQEPTGRHGRHAIGHHGRRGRFRSAGGDGFMGEGGGFPRGRKLGAADLQLAILAMIEKKPMHGYELIRLFEEHSGGFYTPSPGVIYPALTYLEELGHLALSAEGARKQYALTESGLAHLTAHRDTAEAILNALARIGKRMEDVREALSGMGDPDPAASEALHAARGALRRALSTRRGCSPDEARRVAHILDQATAAILGHQ
jgi:DNA-binding PadR family transcriptional regulator